MMALQSAGPRVRRSTDCRKYVLPTPLQRSLRIFARQRVRQLDTAEATLDRVLVQQAHVLQVKLQFFGCRGGENGDAILHALSVTDQDPAVIKVNVFDA